MATNLRPRVIELFAGAGLFGEAFRQAGCLLEHAYELDPTACASYARNVDHSVSCADLTRKRPEGRCDILIAGPPCQGFSTLGKRDPTDPRNRLALIVPRWARALRPEIVVIENVAAFANSPTHRRLIRELEKIRLHVQTLILDASEFGAAQIRTRSFTVAMRSFSGAIEPRHRKFRSVKEAWQDLPCEPSGSVMSYAPAPSDLALSRFKVTPEGGDKRSVMESAPSLAAPSWWRAPGAVTDVWGRMWWDRPSNTLRTAFQNPSKGRYIHPAKNRVISLREGARLQGMPDRWQLHGRPAAAARQIGNGVPLHLARAVARAIMRAA